MASKEGVPLRAARAGAIVTRIRTCAYLRYRYRGKSVSSETNSRSTASKISRAFQVPVKTLCPTHFFSIRVSQGKEVVTVHVWLAHILPCFYEHSRLFPRGWHGGCRYPQVACCTTNPTTTRHAMRQPTNHDRTTNTHNLHTDRCWHLEATDHRARQRLGGAGGCSGEEGTCTRRRHLGDERPIQGGSVRGGVRPTGRGRTSSGQVRTTINIDVFVRGLGSGGGGG